LSGGVLAWLSVWSEGADLHMAQLMPLPLTVSCFSKIQIGFTSLVPAHPGSQRKRAVKRVCVCHTAQPAAGMRSQRRQLSTDISCLHGAQQQTRRPLLLQRIDGTDGLTETLDACLNVLNIVYDTECVFMQHAVNRKYQKMYITRKLDGCTLWN